jgi:hypothetical protein
VVFGILGVGPRGVVEEGGHYVFTLCNLREFCELVKGEFWGEGVTLGTTVTGEVF